MYLDDDLPTGYVPYAELRFCSNSFNNTQIPLAVEGHPPLLIGNGPKPRIWLSATLGKGKKQWATVVKDNQAQYAGVVVQASSSDVKVFVEKRLVLHVTASNEQSAEVTTLDLRPLGFNIHGNRTALWVGTNEFSSNTISNCRAGIGIGG